ncbi:hypothetical protein D1872_252490 [compost metagenome]
MPRAATSVATSSSSLASRKARITCSRLDCDKSPCSSSEANPAAWSASFSVLARRFVRQKITARYGRCWRIIAISASCLVRSVHSTRICWMLSSVTREVSAMRISRGCCIYVLARCLTLSGIVAENSIVWRLRGTWRIISSTSAKKPMCSI